MKSHRPSRVAQQLLLCAGIFLAAVAGISCRPANGAGGKEITLIFKHAKHPRYAYLSRLVAGFERDHPGVHVREEILPASTDEQHQYYVINLAGHAGDFDVLDMDVIWVPEFARAGWLVDLTSAVSPTELAPLNPSALRADWLGGKLYGVPWFVDAGILYYRKDLLEKYGLAPPQTFPQLRREAQEILRREGNPRLAGDAVRGVGVYGTGVYSRQWRRRSGCAGPARAGESRLARSSAFYGAPDSSRRNHAAAGHHAE